VLREHCGVRRLPRVGAHACRDGRERDSGGLRGDEHRAAAEPRARSRVELQRAPARLAALEKPPVEEARQLQGVSAPTPGRREAATRRPRAA
jgi:hypothetical protein